MKKLNQWGFAHWVLVAVLVSVGGVSAAGYTVFRHNKTQSKTSSNTTPASAQKNILDSKQNTASTADTQSTATSTTSSPKSKLSNTAPATSQRSSSAPTQPANTGNTPDTSQQKLAALTAVIDGLKNGGSATITAAAVTVPGPISNAQARPIIFGVKGGGTYFAYRQGQAPDFSQSPAAIAGSMAIISANSTYGTQSAHINKSNVLVDANSLDSMVGYSVGGN